uniref:Uncharacterized protein n=1 Tax=Anguilla anguilla TaxID=7936 RepID=A0A0E9RS00_ANGAN
MHELENAQPYLATQPYIPSHTHFNSLGSIHVCINTNPYPPT